ncbi:hypothetical protein M513_02337 [Trichuris suis]|uniref:Uncharacterized protein n=1 Tax=Trichuris suis TaxID=68888 RepID=A0A085MHG5_9BILA|nr:hypothetical protein M513_02337 [Trichuris suis]
MTRGRCRPKHILSSPARGSMLTEHFQSQKKTMTLSMLGWRAMPPHRTVGPNPYCLSYAVAIAEHVRNVA